MTSRITKLRQLLKARSLDGIVVTYLPHVRYLCGFTGSAAVLLVTRKHAVCFSDFRYAEQLTAELVNGVKGIIDTKTYERMLADRLVEPGMTIGIQDAAVTMAAFEDVKKRLRKVKLVSTGSLVTDLVMIKTPEEIADIRKAADIAAKVYRHILGMVKPGMRENEVALEIGYMGRKLGAEGDAFGIIVASGERGALPHGRASTKKIRKGELVTLDFGFTYNGLNSDMTRTFAVGTPGDEARRIYDIVLEAQIKGVAAARAGVTGKHVDDACRDIIKAAGYGDQFGHSTGHGLGIDVHEMPRLSFVNSDTKLQPGMVVTVEPGIYIPGRCGVRIEDDIAITADGCDVLTSSPKKLIVV
ncbi:MAG: aminopeptidase P family protein [Bacteroidetes bacterium]|nr:aminopeptidase P family protein [Bacteroidota bacterium]